MFTKRKVGGITFLSFGRWRFSYCRAAGTAPASAAPVYPALLLSASIGAFLGVLSVTMGV